MVVMVVMDYVFKTAPAKHQKAAFLLARDKDAFALFMEQGTGKTKTALDIAAWNYARGVINCVLVFTPSGVQRNWTEKEVPKHLPDHVPYRTYTWKETPTAKKAQRRIDVFLAPGGPELRIVAMHYEALLTDSGKNFLRQLVRGYRVFAVADESHYIKNPRAKRTDIARRVGMCCTKRLLLSGTPIVAGPLDVYGQFRFLEGRHECSIIPYTREATFRAQFAEVDKIVLEGRGKMRANGTRGDIRFEKVRGYKNLDQLERMLAPYSFQALKSECLDLPPKTYRTRDINLTPVQRRVYDDLLELGASGLEVREGESAEDALWRALTDPDCPAAVADNASALYMRLQEVVGGFVRDKEGKVVALPGKNPLMDTVLDEVSLEPGKVVVWARFQHEVEALVQRYNEQAKDGSYAVAHYGGISKDQRWENAQRFQDDPACRLFAGTPDTGGRGIDLYRASHTMYYSCSYNWEHRAQSEDRMHRHGFEGPTATYTDFVVAGTVIERVVENLQKKGELAAGFRWGENQCYTKDRTEARE